MDYVNIFLGQTASIATVITAIVAFLLYRRSKRDELENAARIVILEIRESEKILKSLIELKNSGGFYKDDLIKIMPFKGWAKYSHLFIQKLNNDEYDQINEYFKKCEVLEKYLEKNHNFFWVTTEERARQKEVVGAKVALEYQDGDPEVLSEKIDRLTELYFQNTSAYSPIGIKTQVDRNLNSITMLTTMPVWNKLKEIAKYKDLLG